MPKQKYQGQRLTLEAGPAHFCGLFRDAPRLWWVMAWRRDTNVANLVLTFGVAFGVAWPPVRWFNVFVDLDE